MNSSLSQQIDRQALREQALREELAERMARTIGEDGTVDPLPDVRIIRRSAPTESLPNLSDPALGVIAQGSKELYLGDEHYRYDPYHYCLGTVELPVVSRIVEASHTQPYLSLRLALDPVLIGAVMMELGEANGVGQGEVKALHVSQLDEGLLDAVVRLVRLFEMPTAAPVLAPLVKREIVCRLLLSQQGNRLRYIAVLRGYTSPIAQAIECVRKNYDQQLRMEEVAQTVGMSVSSLHHQFKAVTAITPLQFQKRLRLLEARRLLLGEQLDATSTAFRVGYNDASHFNREYKRLFGLPPLRDVERLRAASAPAAD